MITRTIGGWALLINALLILFILIGMTTSVGGDTLSLIIAEALSPLFIVGLLAIWAMQPHAGRLGLLGLIGLWCLGIAAGIAFLVRLVLLVSAIDVGDLVPLSSALFGLVGSLLVGWVTIRAKVFHPTIGWLLIVGGVLNLIGGLLPAGAGTPLVGIITTLAQASAIGGYGWTMLRGATVAQHASIEPR
jgi:hypothetical protein